MKQILQIIELIIMNDANHIRNSSMLPEAFN